MPNIRVTCPACKSELEIDSEFIGKEVECGSCLEVFVANPPGGKKPGPGSTSGSSAGTSGAGASGTGSSRGRTKRDDDDEDDDRPKRRPKRRRRRDDEDDDYERDRRDEDEDDDYYSPPARRGGGGSGLAITSLILGITAFFPGCCCYMWIPLSLGAIVTGSIGMKTQQGKGMAIAGVILGVCALALYGVLTVIGLGMNMNNRFR
jgi:predicted Zn finger-like uncharacterized protein